MKLNKTIIISLVAHIILIALLAFNYHFSKVEVKQNKSIRSLKASMVSSDSLVKKANKNKNKKTEQLRKIKQQQDKKRKKEKQRKDEKDKKRKLKEKKQLEDKKKKKAKEKARKKKISAEKLKREKKKKKEKKRKSELAKKKKALEKKKEREKQKKLAEEKAAQQKLEKELQRQILEEKAMLNAAQEQYVLTEADKYNLLIRNKIKRNWIAPEQKGSCVFKIKIAPGGLIMGIDVISGNSQHCDSGRRAINKSEPLPMSSDPDVFAVLKTRTFELENKTEKQEYDFE